MIHTPFEINPQLEASTILVENLPLCQVRLKNDRRFPWVILIPQRLNLVEIFDLTPEDQRQLWSEVTRVTQHMHDIFQAQKMNIEMLGNKVRQLHIHIIARYENDAAWPASILNHGTAEPYPPEEATKRIQELAQR